MRNFLLLLFFLFVAPALFAQKSFVIHLTIDKIFLGNDSLVFKKGKTWALETQNKTDTVEIGKAGTVPVAIVIDVKRILVDKRVQYKIGYAFFKKTNSRWELIRHFGYVSRYDLISVAKDYAAEVNKRPAREEYNCQWSDPALFAASFRMDVFKKN